MQVKTIKTLSRVSFSLNVNTENSLTKIENRLVSQFKNVYIQSVTRKTGCSTRVRNMYEVEFLHDLDYNVTDFN